MLKNIQTAIKIVAMAIVFTIIPSQTFAGHNDSSGFYGSPDAGWDDWSSPSTGYYSYDTPIYDYAYDYTPYSYSTPTNYGNSGYSVPTVPSYGGYNYPSSNYRSSYVPSYGSQYTVPTMPSNTNTVVNTTNTNNTASNANANASAVASNNNVNNNVNNNNVYVYTNPSGNAVVHNPAHQYLNIYCIATPTSPRVGQTVTVTAYATGGIGSYSYAWGGDINQYPGNMGASFSFTSNNVGTKNINVTVTSGQEVKTASCSVNFVANYTYGYTTPTIPTVGTPVSSVYVQPAQIRRVTTGTPVSGVYLNDLPATGIDLNWKHYMGALMVIVLGSVMFIMSRSREKLYATQE